jgi:hypothetical protein
MTMYLCLWLLLLQNWTCWPLVAHRRVEIQMFVIEASVYRAGLATSNLFYTQIRPISNNYLFWKKNK